MQEILRQLRQRMPNQDNHRHTALGTLLTILRMGLSVLHQLHLGIPHLHLLGYLDEMQISVLSKRHAHPWIEDRGGVERHHSVRIRRQALC